MSPNEYLVSQISLTISQFTMGKAKLLHSFCKLILSDRTNCKSNTSSCTVRINNKQQITHYVNMRKINVTIQINSWKNRD